jgi:hypothetical protein
VTLIPAVAEKEQVFVPSELWEMVTGFEKIVFVWLPDSAAENVKLYFVPLMVKVPFFVALELMV